MNTGQQLWKLNRTTPTGSTAFGMMGRIADGVYTEYDKGALQWRGYSIDTGDQIWGPTQALTNPWDSQPYAPTSAYGIMYTRTMAGVHAIELKTGKILWDFYAEPSGVNFPGMSAYPFLAGEVTIADQKVFAPTGNSHGDPLFRGAKLYAINANSGQQAWSINGFFLGTLPVADGYLIGQNGYDNQIYCFGKGQTATTVTATPGTGNTITIQGTVTDQSPGQTCLGTPAAGTAAIADESMSAWMEYLYMQQPIPTNAKGVPVTLFATDPNGNTANIGTTTTDTIGQFGISWTPSSTGLYKITASFDGSNSYYASAAETSMAVGATSTSQGQTKEVSQVPAEIFYAIAAVIIILLIVVVAVLVLKRK